MEAVELRKMSYEELRKELLSLLREQFNLRMKRGSEQQVRPHLFKKNRRIIARINTVLREKADSES